MRISGSVRNTRANHEAWVETDGHRQALDVPPKSSGQGSGVNGGEFLMLALATCYCNDLYREAERLGVVLNDVEVEASADFMGVGLAAENVRYRARVDSPAPRAAIETLLEETDAVAEIHNTVRARIPVTLEAWTRG